MRTMLYGGRVIDPANGVDDQLDVYLENGVIMRIGRGMIDADEVIDVTGKVICPGFIDCHVHEDPLDESGRIWADPDKSVFSCMLRMGVTTVVAGNCGSNVCHPVRYLDLADRDGTAVNVAMLAGHEFFRTRAGADDPRSPADQAQCRQMAAGMLKAMENGCAGVSFGIRYTPGMDEHELRWAASSAMDCGKLAAFHLRDDAGAVFDALQEAADMADYLKMPIHISHIGSMAGFGQMERFLALVSAMRMSGTDVTCDCYPYDAFSTGLGSATYDDGWLERYGCGYDVLELCEGRYKGMRCTEELFRRVRRELPGCRTVCHVMDPAQVALAIAHPSVMIASDATMNHGQGHPRAAGTFPRVFAQYVRTGKLSLYDAVAKMTSIPARRFGLKEKGVLYWGTRADITVFDPEKICDKATFDDPTAPPAGIEHVFIDGQPALRDGKIVNGRLGRSVRV